VREIFCPITFRLEHDYSPIEEFQKTRPKFTTN